MAVRPNRRSIKRFKQRIEIPSGVVLCAYCGVYSESSVDHVVPLELGGVNHHGNMVPACDFCNRFKGSMTLDEFRAMIMDHLTGSKLVRKGLRDRVGIRWQLDDGVFRFHFQQVEIDRQNSSGTKVGR